MNEMERLDIDPQSHAEVLTLQAPKEQGCELPRIGKSQKPLVSTKNEKWILNLGASR